MRAEGFKRGVASILLVFALVFSMMLVVPLASPGDLISDPGGTTIEVMAGENFLIRHVLEWNEPEDGAYTVTIAWLNYDNKPEENFTFLSAEAYFTTGSNAGEQVQADVMLASAPSGSDTIWALSVKRPVDNKDPRNGKFNVDILMGAYGAGGVPHIPGDHVIPFQFAGIIIIESSLQVWNRDPVTIRVLGRGVSVSISPSYQTGAPGATLEYTVTVTNTGSVEDNFSLENIDNLGWHLELDNSWLVIPPWENGVTNLRVTIPPDAASCTEDNVTVIAKLLHEPAVKNRASCVAHALSEGLISRGPIYIDGNDNFTPANGVVGGSGTENDPYIIENWDISAENANGIEIRNTTAHFVIRNCYVHDGKPYYRGIYFKNVLNGKIDNNIVENNEDGMVLLGSKNNIFNNLVANNRDYGISLYYSYNTLVEANRVEGNDNGISLDYSNSNTIQNNTCLNNENGIKLYHSDNNLISNNISRNNGTSGIWLDLYSANNTLLNNIVENNEDGILLWGSKNNIISNNIVKYNNFDGIYLGDSDNNLIMNNVMENNYFGIDSWYSDSNLVVNNIVGKSVTGIRLVDSHNNLISNNMVKDNPHWRGIYLAGSDNNLVINNLLENNGYGIRLSANNNHIYHNNFMNNATQAYVEDGYNYWDDGYPSGGNYWSDYTGVDENMGENQDIPGSDGIGDTPYYISGGANRDRYPLMEPWMVKVPEVTVIVEGKDTAYNTDLEGPSPLKSYASSPPLMVAAKVGSGAVVATGTVSTTRDTRWNNINNPAPNFDVLLDKVFQWMVPGATKVLWFEGYGVYNTIDTPEVQCQQLEDALEAKGYTLTGDATTPITSGLLSGYDIMVIPQMQLGESGTGGNPDQLPDSDVQAIVDFVNGGGGLLIMESSDYLGLNYSEVHNKILKSLGVGFYFQDDQVQDDTNNWGGANYQPIADVDTTTEIGSAYQSETGVNEIGLYSICSLRIEKDYEVSVTVSPTIKVGGAGEVLIYDATITNTGTKSDTYILTAEDELGWPVSLSKNEASLEPGESTVVEVRVTVPISLTEKIINWITLTASGVSEDDARFRAINIFPREKPPYPIVRPDVVRFLGPGLPTLLVDLPAVPIITAVETGFSVDLTPREPEPILYGKGEFAPVIAAELIDNGRVIALANSILRDAYYDRPELANDEVMSMIVRWMLDWADPRGHSLLYWVTEGSYHLPPGTGAPIVTKYIEVTLKEGFGMEVGTQVGGEITPELISGYDIVHLNEILRPLSHQEIQAVVDYVNGGGALIIGCQADYGGYGRPTYPNELLEALGSGIRFQDDELYDEDSWVVDGPWYPQVYLLDPREANPEFDVWFPMHDFAIYMPVRSMTLESARALFTTILTNVGTVDSTYTIEVTETTIPEKVGWDVEVKQAEIEVAAGKNVEIYTVVTVPDIEAGRKRMDLNIKVTDAVQTYLTRSNRFAVLGEDGRMPPEAKFEVGQRVSHVDWGEVTIEDVAWGGNAWAYVVETAEGELKLAAEAELAEILPVIEWDASITVTFSGGGDDALFGVRPDATDNFDSAYDIPEPPAPPEPPHVRAYFYYPGQTPDELHCSYLAPENLMGWPLRIDYAGGLEDITLTWNVEDVPADYSIFLYRGGDLVADMRAEENYTFEASTGSYDFRIVVGRIVPFTLELTRGWNMISFPVLPEDSSPDTIFDGYYVLYRWDAEDKRYVLHADSGSFIEPDPDVEAGVGYWDYVLEDENVNLLGVPVNQLTLGLHQGWSLIGPPYGGSSIADPADDPDNSVLPYVFTWNAHEKSYRMTQLLKAGKGYWAYALRDCTLTLMAPAQLVIELAYDDGTWEYSRMVSPGYGGISAVKFSLPTGWTSAKLLTARYCMGHALEFKVHIYTSDGVTELTAPFTVTPTEVGWFDVDLSGLNIIVTGDFYIAKEGIIPSWVPPYIYVDSSPPIDGRSYAMLPGNNSWVQATEWDMGIRAVIMGPR